VHECVHAQQLSGAHLGRRAEVRSETGHMFVGTLEDIQHTTALPDSIQVSLENLDAASPWVVVFLQKSSYVRFLA
jgi:hypothetical protein